MGWEKILEGPQRSLLGGADGDGLHPRGMPPHHLHPGHEQFTQQGYQLLVRLPLLRWGAEPHHQSPSPFLHAHHLAPRARGGNHQVQLYSRPRFSDHRGKVHATPSAKMIEKGFPISPRHRATPKPSNIITRICLLMAPPLELLTYEDVTKVYREEKKSTGLTAIRHDFYPAVRVLMEQLKRDYEKEAANDSYGAKARQLSQTIARMREKTLQIFDMRADKVMHMAVLGAAGGKADHSRLTEEERRLLESGLSQVQGMRNGLLDLPRPANIEFTRMSTMPMPSRAEGPEFKVEDLVPEVRPVTEVEALGAPARKEGSGVTPLTSRPTIEQPTNKGTEVRTVSLEEPVEVATATIEKSRPTSEMILLRILEDIPPFAGPSGTYELGKEDIIALPAGVGKALVKKGKAVEIFPATF